MVPPAIFEHGDECVYENLITKCESTWINIGAKEKWSPFVLRMESEKLKKKKFAFGAIATVFERLITSLSELVDKLLTSLE